MLTIVCLLEVIPEAKQKVKKPLSFSDLGGGPQGPPPYGPKCSQFHAVFQKIWQFRMLASPGRLAPPPMGNPGSAPAEAVTIQTKDRI